MKEIDYRDQAGSNLNVYGTKIISFYTPYGIKSIDTDFCMRIQNLHNKVYKVFQINRRKPILIDKKGKEYKSWDYKTYYDEIDPFNIKWGTLGIRVVWVNEEGNKIERDFQSEVDDCPKFDKETKKESVKTIMKDIKRNPHLHKDIKNNLLENLKRNLK